MKYKILIAHTPIELSWGVNRQIAKEWRPLGGIAIDNTAPDGTCYFQAMEMRGAVEVAENGRIGCGEIIPQQHTKPTVPEYCTPVALAGAAWLASFGFCLTQNSGVLHEKCGTPIGVQYVATCAAKS